ncbi:carboxymuconolactone decarboxylase family protein [Bordetella genomosp. 11]|uniref:Alkylhydroperoxidase n=1 Tax=Bordetella genomosp. 11 TaxID=1416808 RepID=A0A261UM12_9BORD|nr:carboxymuconolactone decarboxylase family protein [Bordetella genomosp. 11]OZI62671.1 alkylhydroperoxidase [Bordetella genomosp. 11]
MSQRLNYYKASAETAKKYIDFSQSLKNRPVIAELGHLVTLRASQLNGCAFCVDMHVKEGKIHGERELRLHHVAIWWESPLFNEREKAALAWTEIVTHLPAHGVPDEAYESVCEHFSEEEVSDLTFLIVGINGWNRLSVAFRPVPGSADEMFGLGKAGLK